MKPEFENMTDDDYHALWDELGPIEIKMTEKHGLTIPRATIIKVLKEIKEQEILP